MNRLDWIIKTNTYQCDWAIEHLSRVGYSIDSSLDNYDLIFEIINNLEEYQRKDRITLMKAAWKQKNLGKDKKKNRRYRLLPETITKLSAISKVWKKPLNESIDMLVNTAFKYEKIVTERVAKDKKKKKKQTDHANFNQEKRSDGPLTKELNILKMDLVQTQDLLTSKEAEYKKLLLEACQANFRLTELKTEQTKLTEEQKAKVNEMYQRRLEKLNNT